MWTCTPLPASPGSSSGVNVDRRPARRAHSRTTSRSTTARSAAAIPGAGATGTSNWWLANSAKKRSGSAPASTSAAITALANGSASRMRRQRERQLRRAIGPQLELVLEGGEDRRSGRAARAPPARGAGTPRGQHGHGGAVALDDVAQQQLERGLRRPRRADPDVRGGVGEQAQVAGRAERVRFRQRAERGQGGVRGHPADARREVLLELGGEHRAPAHDRAEVAGDERDQLGRGHAVASGVPLSQSSSRSPSAAAARAERRGLPRVDDRDHASGRLVLAGRSRRRAARAAAGARRPRPAPGRCRRPCTGARRDRRCAPPRTRSGRRPNPAAGPSSRPSSR